MYTDRFLVLWQPKPFDVIISSYPFIFNVLPVDANATTFSIKVKYMMEVNLGLLGTALYLVSTGIFTRITSL